MKTKRFLCFLCAVLLLFLSACGTQKTPAEAGVCTVSIVCDAVLGNDDFNEAKREFVPEDGVILPQTSVPFSEGETVLDVLKRVCTENTCADNCAVCQNGGIALEYTYTPVYGTYYIEGIHNLYEKDCGSTSGWTFLVNGEFAMTGCSETELSDGDTIEWVYSTGM